MSNPDERPDEREGGFLRGWSRRKLAAKREPATPEPQKEPPVSLSETPPLAPDAENADLIAALPSLDDITAGFDISPFLARGVPVKLKNAALRKLWMSSPSVRNYVDPAVDYAWDWNAPGGVPGGTGRGVFRGGGGLLAEESVAKMVRDLIGKPTEVAEKADMQAASGQEIDPSGAARQSAAEAPPDAGPEAVLPASVRRKDPDARPSPPPSGNAGGTAQSQQANLAPPNRHGGAVPK